MKKHLLNAYYILFILILLISAQSAKANPLPSKKEIKKEIKRVATWQMENFTYSTNGSAGHLHDYGIDAWTNAVLYLGMMNWVKIAETPGDYYDWLYKIGEETQWKLPENFAGYPKYSLYHADELCIGQFYLEMYLTTRQKEILQPVIERANWIINHTPDTILSSGNKQIWSWCDALFMAPPVYAGLYKITQDSIYLTYMNKEFNRTYNYLFDKEELLFFRDASYFKKKETNGEKIFWGRGNAWVIAGIVNILKYLPEDSEYCSFYKELFQKHIKRLLELRDNAGFWHASLLDPESYPVPETSATALITYALAYGINNGLLDKNIYISTLEKSWKALCSVISDKGKLGYIQPIGADPGKVNADMTAVYGVGAFLMAGSEIYKLAKERN